MHKLTQETLAPNNKLMQVLNILLLMQLLTGASLPSELFLQKPGLLAEQTVDILNNCYLQSPVG